MRPRLRPRPRAPVRGPRRRLDFARLRRKQWRPRPAAGGRVTPGSEAKRRRAAQSAPLRLLFVCTGNSARSQMAEGLANHLGEGGVDAHSAGTMPAGVSSYAVAAMRERGIDISAHTSKGIEDVPGPFDLVITLCDHAAALCPASTWTCPREHWPTP